MQDGLKELFEGNLQDLNKAYYEENYKLAYEKLVILKALMASIMEEKDGKVVQA